jgi:hypothetical protein
MFSYRRGTETSTRSDAGSVTLFLAITVVGLLVLLGLVVDGGAKIRAVQHADALAADAARAGGQAINVPAAITGATPTVDARAAVAAANASLRRAGVTGTVSVTDAGQSLDVEVTTTTRTIFLGLIGISTMTVHGHAHVTLVRGVTGATP